MRSQLVAAVMLCASVGCNAAAPPPPAPRLGDVMTQVGHRFELLGRAIQANRWELAEFELGELRETFDDVAVAAIPTDVKADVRQLAKGVIPAIESALSGAVAHRDLAIATAAFATAAKACNSCHQASGKPYIEIPEAIGVTVPRLDPLP